MTELLYKSTRSKEEIVSSHQAILKGLASDGGLYVPVNFPRITDPLDKLKDYTYKELAMYILKQYLADFDEKDLKESIDEAYDSKFDTEEIAPLKKVGDSFFLELYHGPTLAFKDMALSILPKLLQKSAKKEKLDKEIVILTATSGDTGKAALEGFANVEGTKIIVFFPKDGVSKIQRKQMITQRGDNTYVIGIDGNFDDAQSSVKEVFRDKEFNELLDKKGFMFSSANSINIGRLIPQIVYYFYAYLRLLKSGEISENQKINIVVPTGNFGNILAAYYGKKMGLPVNKLICASNENNVLYDFINTGIYDKRRDFKKTISPSMDILVSSNLERLLFELCDRDYEFIKEMMERLSKEGVYEITHTMKEGLKDFYGGYATDGETIDTIKNLYDEYTYLVDTHTAVAFNVYRKYVEDTGDESPTIIASTASPFKFPKSVMEAVAPEYKRYDEIELIEIMAQLCKLEIPKAIENIDKREVLHKKTCKTSEIKNVISEILIK